MAANLNFIYGTEAEILALTPDNPKWKERGFYYPNDQEYFYQALEGQMKQYGGGSLAGVGVKLNGIVIGGSKTRITAAETLDIPTDYDYNTYTLTVEGQINCNGQINIH
jgi:hypothetical protein